jgi:hypothetical protein
VRRQLVRRSLVFSALLATVSTVALAQQGQAAPTGPRFGAPVKITPTGAGGYEPGVIADRFGNLYATAHKENAELALSPDSRSSTLTRSMSWSWYSADHGKTWQNLPGPALGPISPDVQNHSFGDEGDMATDDAGGVYFVDTNVTDISFTSWKATGLGKVSFTGHLPTVGFGEPLDDRPWVAAHLDGHVFYFGNEGNKDEYPLSCQTESCGTGAGPGRYTVYSSYDGGKTWDLLGISLKDSGWCRPAAAPRSTYVYAFCGNDAGKLYAYVSKDDGKRWSRYDVPGGYTAKGGGGFESYPTLQVLKDGSLVGSYLDPDCFKGGVPTCSHVLLFRSHNHGQTWSRTDVTPRAQRSWQMEYGWVAATADGKRLGLGVYARPTTTSPWKVYGSTWTAGQRPVLTLLDPVAVTQADFPEAPGDFLMSTFAPNGKLTVTWTRATLQVNAPDGGATGEGQRSLFRDIYAATTR